MINVLLAALVVFLISVVLGIILALANRFLKVEEDSRIDKVTSLLAGANCGGCGFAGCHDFATSIVEGKSTSLNPCRPTNASKKEEIKTYLSSTPGPDGNVINIK